MKWNLNMFLIMLFIVYFSLSIISDFVSSDVSEIIDWIMIIGFLSFFILIMPKSVNKKRNKKNREG